MSSQKKASSTKQNAKCLIVIILNLVCYCTSYQNNYCPLHEKVENGTLNRRDVLKGLNISVGLQNYVLDSKTGKPGISNPYSAVAVFDELSRRAGFQWRDSFGVVDPPNANQTWTDAMVDTVDNYDLALDWWARTVARVEMGILYPESWMDVSLIMIRKTVTQQTKLDTLAFMKPFAASVWIMILFTIMISALVYYCIDFMTCRGNNDKMELSFGDSMFFAFQAFTGHSNLDPISSPNRLLLISLLFWCLVIITAYTANLTVFLVNKNFVITIDDFEDVLHNNFQVCLWRGGGPEIQFQESYPNANYIPKDSELEIFQGVESGECEIGLVAISQFKIYKEKKEYNPNCNIEWVGRQVQTGGASFTIGDSPYLCSSLLRDVLDIYLLDMIKDKTLDKIMESQQEATTVSCDKKKASGSKRLTSKDIGGIFIVHFVFTVIAAMLALWQFKNPRAVSRAEDLSGKAKTVTRRLSLRALNTKDGEFQEKMDETESLTALNAKNGEFQQEIDETQPLTALNEKDDEFKQEIDDTQSSNSEESNKNVGRKSLIPQDEESTNNDVTSEQKQHELSQVSLKDHEELKNNVEELKNDVKEMKQLMIKLLEKSDK